MVRRIRLPAGRQRACPGRFGGASASSPGSP